METEMHEASSYAYFVTVFTFNLITTLSLITTDKSKQSIRKQKVDQITRPTYRNIICKSDSNSIIN